MLSLALRARVIVMALIACADTKMLPHGRSTVHSPGSSGSFGRCLDGLTNLPAEIQKCFDCRRWQVTGGGWCAPDELMALSGAFVTGLGCALVFPALGVEVLKRVLPANRGSAMGGFVAFLDIAYGLAGPGAGLVAGQFGYAAVYLLGTATALLGAVLVVATRSTPA
jgi:MFS family permease